MAAASSAKKDYLEDVSEAVLVVQGELLLEDSKGSICFHGILLAPTLHAIAAPSTPSVVWGALLGSHASPGRVRLQVMSVDLQSDASAVCLDNYCAYGCVYQCKTRLHCLSGAGPEDFHTRETGMYLCKPGKGMKHHQCYNTLSRWTQVHARFSHVECPLW